MFLVPSTRISTYLLVLILNGKRKYDSFSGIEINSHIAFFIVACLALVFGFTHYKLSRKRKLRGKRFNQENSAIYSTEVQQAFNKFRTRLTEDEQIEFSRLTLYTDKINKVTFINLAKICWNGLILAWLFEVCVELIQRL